MRYNTIYKNMQAFGYSGVSLRLTISLIVTPKKIYEKN